MAVTVDEVQILVTAEVDKALKDLKKVQDKPSNISKSFLDMAKKVAGPAALGLMAKKMVDVSLEAGRLAASAAEVQSKFNVVFGETAKDINNWASDYSDAVGRSETDTLKFLGTIGDTLKPLGFTKDAVDDLSKQVVELAGDLGSFNNLPTEEVVAGIQSALVGNVETLRRYGVVANEAAIKQEALNSGLWDGNGALNAQQKAQAILNITLKGTTDAQGDLLRTADSAANVQVRLESATKDLQIAYGNFVNEGLTPAKAALADFVSGMAEAITAQNTYKKFNEDIADGTIDNVDAIDDYIKSLEAVAERSNGVRKTRIESYLKELYQIREGLQTQKDSWLGKMADDAGRAAAEAAGLAAELERQEALQSSVAEAYAAFQESQLTTEEKAIKDLQAQIDHWAEVRSQMSDTTEVQKLINALYRQQQEIIESLSETSDEEAEKRAADAAQRINEQLMIDEAIKDRAERQKEAEAEAAEAAKQAAAETAQAWQDSYLTIASSALGLFSALSALSSSYGDQELQRMEEQGASEEELEAKKRELAREEAKRQKALGIFNAGISTAQAIIGFLANPGGIPGIVLSALAGATGAAQIAAIAAQPLPALAQGGSFTTSGPMPLLVGDNPGGQETVTVEPVSSNGANVGNSGGSSRIVIDFGGGRELTGWIQGDINDGRLRGSAGGRI